MKDLKMNDKEKYDWEKWEREIEYMKFYALAKKYGFCFPGCGCKECNCRQQQQG